MTISPTLTMWHFSAISGFLFGLVSGGLGLHGAVWGSSDSWPTIEMKSR